jgi:hypothetical protein
VRRGAISVAALGLAVLTGSASTAAARPSVKLTVHRASGTSRAGGPREFYPRLRTQGYLVPGQARYESAKRRAGIPLPARASSPFAAGKSSSPSLVRAWAGVDYGSQAPSDSTGAVGNQRFIETVNSRFAIYDKSGNSPLATGSLQSLWNSGPLTTDPQMLWDPDTKRFYYAGLDHTNPADNLLMFGYSKTASPSGASDFCHYSLGGYGALLPDYPKLGDMKKFTILGVNVFSASVFSGSDLITVSKPPSGDSCVGAGSLKIKAASNLLDSDGIQRAYTPVPANQTDKSGTGYAVALSGSNPNSSKTLTVFKITTNDNGGTKIPTQGKSISVSAYSVPSDAKQPGTQNKLDTLDGRLTQAVSAKDPQKGKLAVWTQHTVKGGAGAEVRWYELDPAKHKVLQKGKVTNSSVYEFNGAISPDRAVNGDSASGGKRMVMGFDVSSSSKLPVVKVVSKEDGENQSSPLTVAKSPNADDGFDCGVEAANLCRWGDYGGATPDPNSSSRRVWLVSMLNNGTSTTDSTWATENFVVKP